MALARSASGPGGLSINTSSANSLFGSSKATTPAAGMFGSTQQASSAGGGLFGNAAKTSAPATAGLFGSTPAASQPQTAGLFGSTTTTSQPAAGGLFGAVTTPAPAAGGLFGSTTTTSQPQTAGLFGSTTATSQPQTGGLFGSTAASQPQQTNSLFGAQPAQNSTTGGGLFGQTQNKPAPSLFGGLGNTQNQQPQPQQSSLFGNLGQSQPQQPQAQPTKMFGSTLPSLGQSNQAQTVPGVRIDLSNIRSTTRFTDLHEDLQKEITNMDNIIQAQIQLKNDCDAIMPSHGSQLAAVAPDVDFVERKSTGVEDALESDAQAIAQVRNLIRTDAEAAKLSFRVIDNLKLPPQFHNTGIWSGKSTSADSRSRSNGEEGAHDLVGFFSKTADELSATLERYQKNITEIELHLRGVEASSGQQLSAVIARRNGGSGGQENPIQELAETLTAFEQSILGVASKVGETRENVQQLQLGEFLTGSGSVKANGKRGGVY